MYSFFSSSITVLTHSLFLQNSCAILRIDVVMLPQPPVFDYHGGAHFRLPKYALLSTPPVLHHECRENTCFAYMYIFKQKYVISHFWRKMTFRTVSARWTNSFFHHYFYQKIYTLRGKIKQSGPCQNVCQNLKCIYFSHFMLYLWWNKHVFTWNDALFTIIFDKHQFAIYFLAYIDFAIYFPYTAFSLCSYISDTVFSLCSYILD